MIKEKQILDVASRIAERFHPQRIILFGSYAYGTPTADSDVDLLVIMPYRGESHRKATEIRLAVDIPFAADILVRSPAEVRRRIASQDFFMQEIVRRGKVLHDADDVRMGPQGRGRLRQRP